jgi:hypothetical protein
VFTFSITSFGKVVTFPKKRCEKIFFRCLAAYRFTESEGGYPKKFLLSAPTEPRILVGEGGGGTPGITEPQNLVDFEFSFSGLEVQRPDSGWESGLFLAADYECGRNGHNYVQSGWWKFRVRRCGGRR